METLKCLYCVHFDEAAWLSGDIENACQEDMDVGDPEEVCRCSEGKRVEQVAQD